MNTFLIPENQVLLLRIEIAHRSEGLRLAALVSVPHTDESYFCELAAVPVVDH